MFLMWVLLHGFLQYIGAVLGVGGAWQNLRLIRLLKVEVMVIVQILCTCKCTSLTVYSLEQNKVWKIKLWWTCKHNLFTSNLMWLAPSCLKLSKINIYIKNKCVFYLFWQATCSTSCSVVIQLNCYGFFKRHPEFSIWPIRSLPKSSKNIKQTNCVFPKLLSYNKKLPICDCRDPILSSETSQKWN